MFAQKPALITKTSNLNNSYLMDWRGLLTLYGDKVSRLFVCAVVCNTHTNRKEKLRAGVREGVSEYLTIRLAALSVHG